MKSLPLRGHWLERLTPVLAVIVLIGLGSWQWHRPSAADAAGYYEQVRLLTERVPMEVAGWQGRDSEPPAEAVQLLRPNAMVSRTYREPATGLEATLIIVHCKDARDMAGHYPPNCYPANGWQARTVEPRTWQVAGQQARGMDYTYAIEHAGRVQTIRVANLIVLPDERFVSRMSDLRTSVGDYTRYFYGAGQVQFVSDERMSVQQRDELFERMLNENAELMALMLRGMQEVER